VAQAESIRIFRQAGIELSWLRCAVSDEEFTKAPDDFTACAQAARAAIVRIQPKSSGAGAERPHSKLAAAGEERVEVLYDMLQEFSADHGSKPGLMLGHVMAHELGHLLLSEQSHASRGIMVPTFGAHAVHSAQRGHLLFTPQQGRRMRDRVKGDRSIALATRD
jgi:hypothetical protein